MPDAAEALRTLAQAVRDDDGCLLDTIVHPAHGMWLWETPGAESFPTQHVTRVGGGSIVVQLDNLGYRQSDLSKEEQRDAYLDRVGSLDPWIARMDRHPADPHAPIYGTCGDGPPTSELRSVLTTKSFASYSDSYEGYREASSSPIEVMAPELMNEMAVFRTPEGLSVWFLRDQGRLWIAHVVLMEPCGM